MNSYRGSNTDREPRQQVITKPSSLEKLKSRILYPQRSFLIQFSAFTFLSLLLMQTVRTFYITPRDYAFVNVDVYPIFQGIELRDTIRSVIMIYEGAFFSQMSVFIFGLFAMLISMMEQCVIQHFIPQFRGTYDDRQDEILSVDWSAQDEMLDRAQATDRRIRVARSTEDYSLRLSELKCTYEDLLRKDKKAKRRKRIQGQRHVKSNLPKKCAICFNGFQLAHQCIGLNCSPQHVFHWDCLLDWLKRQRSCPLCRAQIKYLLPRSIFYGPQPGNRHIIEQYDTAQRPRHDTSDFTIPSEESIELERYRQEVAREIDQSARIHEIQFGGDEESGSDSEEREDVDEAIVDDVRLEERDSRR